MTIKQLEAKNIIDCTYSKEHKKAVKNLKKLTMSEKIEILEKSKKAKDKKK